MAVKAGPARALPGGAHLAPLLFMLLVLSTALVVLCLCFLFCPAKRGYGCVAATARAQVKGCKKDPYFCTLTLYVLHLYLLS